MCHLKGRDEYPPVLQLVNPKSSLIVAVLQYLSSLIGSPSTCTRLCLVFALRGVRTFADWKRLWPGDVELLSNAVLLMSASLERRQRLGFIHLFISTSGVPRWFANNIIPYIFLADSMTVNQHQFRMSHPAVW